MTTHNDGGPAFPLGDFQWNEANKQNNGMTLRDYFAAAALQGIINDRGAFAEASKLHASIAYAHADAMLAERQKAAP